MTTSSMEGFFWYSRGSYLSLPDIQAIPGCFIFLGDPSLRGLLQSRTLQSRIDTLTGGGRALVWVEKNNVREEADCKIHVIRFDEMGVTTADASISFGGLLLFIPAGSTVRRSGDATRLTISSAAEAERAMTFGPSTYGGGSKMNKQQVEVSVGDEPGRLLFSASMPISALEASVRYFYDDPSQESVGAQSLGAFYYPVFEAGVGGEAHFQVSIDPSRPTDASRTYLTLVEGETYPTNFRSTLGKVIKLTPVPGQSGVASQWDPLLKQAYTVLLGDWALTVGATQAPPAPVATDVMLGLSGVEYGRVADGSIMRFEPGGPSYSPNFMNASLQSATSLTSRCPGSEFDVTTAWIYFADNMEGPSGVSGSLSLSAGATAPTAPRGYYSQPHSAGLFTPEFEDDFLQVLNLRAGLFPSSATGVLGAPKASFPMAPYAGVMLSSAGEADALDLIKLFN